MTNGIDANSMRGVLLVVGLELEGQPERQLTGAIAAGRIQSALAAQAGVQSLPANTCRTA